MEMEVEADDAQSCAIKGERKMSVQASEVRELIEEMRGNYGYDVDTGERVDLEHGIPQQYEPILSRMEAGGEMTFDEEWRFVDAYSFFCRKHDRSNEVQWLLKEAEVRLLQTEQMQAYWDGEGDGRCYMISAEAVESFVSAFPKAVRIMPADEPVITERDKKRLAAAMEWQLDHTRKWEKCATSPWGHAQGLASCWSPAPDVEWKTLTGKRLVKRFEIVD